MRFNQKNALGISLPKGKREHLVFDDDVPGFGLRVREGGSRNWVVQFRVGTKQRRLTLGSVQLLDATAARHKARDLLAAVRLGQDPAGEKAEGRARAAETMAATLQHYLAYQRGHLKPRSYSEVERHLLKHCRQLHGLQLAKIDRRAVAATITACASSGAVTANRVRASLSAFFAWAMRAGLIDQNPVIGTDRHDEQSRDRVLSAPELKAIWLAARRGDYADCVRLLMLTGQRLSEIAALRWSEIKGDQIELPPERTKNGRRHFVPLSAPARAILDARPRRPDRDLVFGHRENRPLSGWGELKTKLDARISNNGTEMPAWVHHDLRRSVATHMAEKLNIMPHVIEAVLNHVSGHKHGVAGIYNRADYEVQKRQALTLWAEYLLATVEDRETTVVPLRA
jgi:integrase